MQQAGECGFYRKLGPAAAKAIQFTIMVSLAVVPLCVRVKNGISIQRKGNVT